MNIPGDLQPLPQTTESVQTTGRTSAAHAAAAAQPSAKGAVNKAEAGSSTLDADQANLSAVASLVSQALGESDVRLDKVAAVQSALSSGSYQVSSSQVAAKVIDHLLEGGR